METLSCGFGWLCGLCGLRIIYWLVVAGHCTIVAVLAVSGSIPDVAVVVASLSQ